MLRFVLFCLLECIFLATTSVQVTLAQTNISATDQVEITAKVALSPQRVFAIKKNSEVIDNTVHQYFRIGEQLQYQLLLRDLQDEPLKNIPVVITFTNQETQQHITKIATSDQFGVVTFKEYLDFQFSATNYLTTFAVEHFDENIDLFYTDLIHLIHNQIHAPKIEHKISSIYFNFPQVNWIVFFFSVALILATLRVTEKPYGITQSVLETPAAFLAAARDGPVALCGASLCSHQRPNSFSRKSR